MSVQMLPSSSIKKKQYLLFVAAYNHSAITALPVESGLALKFKATEGPI